MQRKWNVVQMLMPLLVITLALPGICFGEMSKRLPENVDPLVETYMPVVKKQEFETVMKKDVGEKSDVMKHQKNLLERRYDLSDRASKVMMSGGRKSVQEGVRVQLPKGMTWEKLAKMTPEEICEKGLFPEGFLPLPHTKHQTGGQVFPEDHIKEIEKLEKRSLRRFDVEFDIPEHFLPEFPPPIFLTTRPDLGDVSHGKLLSIKNYYEIMHGILTPVQMEGLRLLLTPFPQQQFNQTEDRKSEEPSLGVSCLDCHANGHTNGAFPKPGYPTASRPLQIGHGQPARHVQSADPWIKAFPAIYRGFYRV